MNSRVNQTDENAVLKWENCLHIIKENVSAQQFKTWFAPITFQSYANNVLTIEVPSNFVYEYLEEHFINLLGSVLTRVYGAGTKLMYRVQADKTNNITVDYEASNRPVTGTAKTNKNTQANKAPNVMQLAKPQDLDPQLNPGYRFENFIEGNSNKLPSSVGKAVAERPAQTAFNPLFIYGPSGVGKTHLINAIGSQIKETHPNKRVLYLSAHLFQVQYTDSVRNNTVNDFINFYQTIDVLIIDDIQEFASLNKTQNTFFHIFNHLHQNGKQLILTSDRPPVALQGMEERLLTRFKWGLLAELERPNEDLRREILQSKINHDGLQFSKEVINYIAENVSDSVRDLEGIVNSLMAYSVVYNRNIDMTLAEKVIKRAVKIDKKPITVDLIIEKTCEHFKINIDDIFTASRKRAIVQVRQIAMYLAQKHTDYSSARIGSLIGKRDHATVLHSCSLVQGRLQVDKNFKHEVDTIEASLKNKQKAFV